MNPNSNNPPPADPSGNSSAYLYNPPPAPTSPASSDPYHTGYGGTYGSPYDPPVAAPTPIPVNPQAQALAAAAPLARRAKMGANWFYWIAGLSLVNLVVQTLGIGLSLAFGLGITLLFDAIGRNAGGTIQIVALVGDVIVAGIFVLFGYLANQRQTWAFAVGMALYALDAVLLLVLRSWIGAAVHAYALYIMFNGLRANLQLNALPANMQAAQPVVYNGALPPGPPNPYR
ncbi:MAG: hypothetical protein M3Z04_02870 [Chloroflexota bacterium]|nr:hypothetical protein [Chloroflexota bacterium]